jgi:HK97 family phage major capsid protein
LKSVDVRVYLRAALGNLLQVGLFNKVETELVAGTGVGKRLLGILTAATAATVTATKPADRVGEAVSQLAADGWLPDLCLLNPADAFAIASERATTGEYVTSGWSIPVPGSIWSMARVETPAVAAGTAVVLQRSAVLVLDRQTPTVLVSTEDADNFTKNLVTLLAEVRLGMAVLAPRAIRKVTLEAE